MHQKILAKLYFLEGCLEVSNNHLFNGNVCCSILDCYCRLDNSVAKKQANTLGRKILQVIPTECFAFNIHLKTRSNKGFLFKYTDRNINKSKRHASLESVEISSGKQEEKKKADSSNILILSQLLLQVTPVYCPNGIQFCFLILM